MSAQDNTKQEKQEKNHPEQPAEFGGAETVEGFSAYQKLLARMDETGPVARLRSEVELPDFNPAWLDAAPRFKVDPADIEITETEETTDAPVVAANSGGFKRYYSIAAMFFIALVAGAFYFQDGMGLTANGDEVLRLKNGAIVRGIVLERVGNELTVQTRDGIFRINAKEGAGIQYSVARHEDGHGNEIIFLKNGAIVRGEVRERVGGKLIVHTEDGSFQINSGELRAITYIAQSDHEH